MVRKKVKRKSIIIRVWKENAGLKNGDDTFRTFRSFKGAAKRAVMLRKKGRLNSIMVSTGTGFLSERRLTKPEASKIREASIKLLPKTKLKGGKR